MTTTRATAPSSRARTSRVAHASSRNICRNSASRPGSITSEIIHFTGYDVPFPRIEQQVSDPRDMTVGHLLGTADMIAQISPTAVTWRSVAIACTRSSSWAGWRYPSATAVRRSNTPPASICCARRPISSPTCAPSASIRDFDGAYRYSTSWRSRARASRRPTFRGASGPSPSSARWRRSGSAKRTSVIGKFRRTKLIPAGASRRPPARAAHLVVFVATEDTYAAKQYLDALQHRGLVDSEPRRDRDPADHGRSIDAGRARGSPRCASGGARLSLPQDEYWAVFDVDHQANSQDL